MTEETTSSNPLVIIPLELGKSITTCFDFTIKNFKVLFPIFAIVSFPLNLIKQFIIGDPTAIANNATMFRTQLERGGDVDPAQLQEMLGKTGLMQDFVGIAVKGAIFGLVSAIVILIATLAIQQVILKLTEGKSTDFQTAYQQVAPRIVPFLLTSLVFGILVGLASILLIIPGIYLALGWGFYSWIFLTEDKTFFDAFNRSTEIVGGKRLTILGYGLVFGILTAILQGIITAILSPFASMLVVGAVVETVLGSSMLFGLVYSAILFFSLKAAKE
jgi:hypothetical protein